VDSKIKNSNLKEDRFKEISDDLTGKNSELGHADSYIQRLVDENRNHRLRSHYYESHTEMDVSGLRRNLQEKYTNLNREID
jgi:hypothetical protein